MSTWNFNSTGTYYIIASWGGDSNYAGADSEMLTVFVGPQSFIQFQGFDYNYIVGLPFTAGFVTQPMQGVNDFLSIPIGTNVSFTYDFVVLPAGHPVSNVETATVEIPASQQTTRIRNQSITTTLPSETFTVPVNVPADLTPLRLPDGFNQTLNNQFCFIVQKDNGDNYSLNVEAFSDDDLSNMADMGNTAEFNNVSQIINDNTWYQATTIVSDHGVASYLFNINGTLIENTATNNLMNGTKAVTLITNNQNNAIVFKGLRIENLNPTHQSQSPEEKTRSRPSVVPYVVLLILLVATVTSVFYIKRKKSHATKKQIVEKLL
jgi:hypothetical protein